MALRQTPFWIILITPCTLAKISAIVPPPDIWTEDNSTTMGTEANLVGHAGDNAFNLSFIV